MVEIVPKHRSDYPKSFESDFVIRERLDSLFRLDGPISEIISKLKNEKDYYTKKGFKDISIENICYSGMDGEKIYVIYGYREATEDEIKNYKEKEAERSKESLESRKNQYEKLKKRIWMKNQEK